MKKFLQLAVLMLFGYGALAQTPRLSLYEEFTGETCPPCAATNPGLNTLLALPTNTTKIVAIKWQVPIPSAPSNTWSLYQTNKTEIDWRWRGLSYPGYGYTPAINSAPSSKIDGQEATVFGASSGHPANLTSAVIASAASQTAAFSITMNRDWDATGSAVNLTVNIQATANFNAVGPLVFRTVMVEKLIQFSVQPGTNGEKNFEDVAIKSFPTLQSGVSMASTWTTGQTQTFTLNCVIPSYVRKKSEIAFVGFIQDDGNQKVAQAVRAGKQALPNDAVAVSANVGVVCTPSLTPQVTVMNGGLNAITDMTITPYVDGVAKAPFTWSGNLAAGASTALTLNSVTSSTTSGAHTFSYNISAMNAADFNTTNNSCNVSFLLASNYSGNPVAEGFVLGAFPPAGFTIVNPDNGPGWSRSSAVGGYGLTPNSAKYDFFSNTVIGDKDEFILPPMNLEGTVAPELDFDIAYAQRTTSSNDKLEIFVSENCGASWVSVFSESGASMTGVSPIANSAYLPVTSSDWRTESVLLSNYNKPNVLVKFVTTNDNGNNLFIDNINLSQTAPGPNGLTKISNPGFSASVFPNPATSVANVRVVSTAAGNAKISVVNIIGQTVFEKQATLNAGSNFIQVNVAEYAPGVYSVIIDSDKGSVVKKLTIN